MQENVLVNSYVVKGLEKWFNLWRKEATMIMTLLGVREWRLLSEEHITPHSS